MQKTGVLVNSIVNTLLAAFNGIMNKYVVTFKENSLLSGADSRLFFDGTTGAKVYMAK